LHDALPILADQQERSANGSMGDRDQKLIYRALVELRNDIGDLKKMLGTFLYSSFSQKDLKALPQNIQDEVRDGAMSDFRMDVGVALDDCLGVHSFDVVDISEEEAEVNSFAEFFNAESIPSIEDTEQFLIEQALRKYEGNRRKASEALGISERTLYRKLDQYDLQ